MVICQPFPIEPFGNQHPIETLPLENGWLSGSRTDFRMPSPENEGLEGNKSELGNHSFFRFQPKKTGVIMNDQPKQCIVIFLQEIFQNCHRFVSSLIPPKNGSSHLMTPRFHLKISGTSGVIPKQPSSPAAKLVKPGLRCSHH